MLSVTIQLKTLDEGLQLIQSIQSIQSGNQAIACQSSSISQSC